MTLIATAVKHMLAAGMAHEAIVAAVSEMEDQGAAGESARQARNRRYYETKGRAKRLKQSDNVLNSDAPETSENVLPRLNSDAIKTPLARVEDNLLTTEVTGLTIVVSSAGASDWPPDKTVISTLCEAVGSPRLDQFKSPGLLTTSGRLRAWKAEGASWEHDVIPIVTALVRKQGPPITSWKYFDAAVAQSIADNRQALQIPQARHERPDNNRPTGFADHQRSRADANFAGAGLAIARRRGAHAGESGDVDPGGPASLAVVSG